MIYGEKETQYAQNGALEAACREAMEQIEDLHYVQKLQNDGMKKIYAYGIACYKKRCKVTMKEKNI